MGENGRGRGEKKDRRCGREVILPTNKVGKVNSKMIVKHLSIK